jgi:hypothetical protein
MLMDAMDISMGKLEKGMDVSTPHGHIQINPRENTDASMAHGCISGIYPCTLGYIHVPWMHPGIYPCALDASYVLWMHPWI